MNRVVWVLVWLLSAVSLMAQQAIDLSGLAARVMENADKHVDVCDYKGSVYLQSLAEYALATGDKSCMYKVNGLLGKFMTGELKGHGSFISYEVGGTAMALMALNGNDLYDETVRNAAARMWENQTRNDDALMIPSWGNMKERNSVFVDIVLAVTPYLLYTGLDSGNEEYVDYAAGLLLKVHEDLKDQSSGLLNQARACNNLARGQKTEDCWSRGNGWFSLALVSLMRELPKSHHSYRKIRSVAGDFFTSVLRCQDEDGLWHQEMTWPDSYVEMSGSALLLYGIGAAIEEGVLPSRYMKYFRKGLQGMLQYIDEEGNVGNTCSGCLAYLGGTKADYASHAYYCNEPHAFGPVILAFSQALRMGIDKVETAFDPGCALDGRIPQCHVRFISERSGDLAWENDMAAFRMYSRDVRSKVGSGVDYWAKSVDYPILEKWYALNDQGLHYHVDRGEGYDFYSVGKARGIGGTGIWTGDSLAVSEPYANYRIYADTPEFIDFEMTFQPYKAGDETIYETRRITMEPGSSFYDVTSTIVTESGNDVLLAVGLSDFGKASVTTDLPLGVLSLVETLDGGHGTIASAVVADPWNVSGFAESGIDRLMLLNVRSGKPVTYKVGAAWEGDFRYDGIKEKWTSALLKEISEIKAKARESYRPVAEGGCIHRFFDTSPISPSGKYIAVFRLPYEDHAPAAGDEGEVVVLELATGRQVYSAMTRGWEMQMGANVQWGATDRELFYNDVDTDTWSDFAVCADIFTGEVRRCAGTVFMVSPDGTKLSSYNLQKSRFAQTGYGVIVPDWKVSRNIGPVADDGVYVTDLEKNECRMIASIKDIYEKSVPSIRIDDPENYEYYCFQTKWNPQGTRILTTVQWTPRGGGERRRAVITMNPDGSDIRTAVTPDQWWKGGHHINWMPDGDHLSMNLNVDGRPGVEIISVGYDGSELTDLYHTGSGHPSFHPLGLPYVLTDAYSGEVILEDGRTPIRLIDISIGKETVAASVDLPEIRNFELRIDAHPVWDRTGRYVVFNGRKDGRRCVYMIDMKELMN